MITIPLNAIKSVGLFITLLCLSSTLILLQSCGDDDNEKETNQKETVSTVNIMIFDPTAPVVEPIDLYFEDPEGDGIFVRDDMFPETVVLLAGKTYNVYIVYWTSTEGEIEAEKDDHLVCFSTTGNVVAVEYTDEDTKGLPFGVSTDWTGGSGSGDLKVTLRHQPGTKDGDCPGEGVTDAEVVVSLTAVD